MVIHVVRALGRRTSTVIRRMVDVSTLDIDRNVYKGVGYSTVSVFDTYVSFSRLGRRTPRTLGFLCIWLLFCTDSDGIMRRAGG